MKMATPVSLSPSARIFGFASVAWAVSLVGMVQGQFGPECEDIKIPMCQNMPYNRTRLPNLLHHSTQENAQLAMGQFDLLGLTKCSDQLEFFLCSMYAPICTVGFVSEAIPPCRSVCEAARLGCEPLLANYKIPWPSNLQCENLPVYDRGVCITPQAIISSDVTPQPPQEEADVSTTPTLPAPCECRKPRLLQERVYKRRRFDYALRGTVKSVDTFGELTLVTVAVRKVVRMGQVQLSDGFDAHLWTNRSCACPPLVLNEEYLLLGWEDFANNRLLYLDGSIAVPYKRKYVRKIQKWDGVTTPRPGAVTTTTPSVRPLGIQVGSSEKWRRRRRRKKRKKNQRGRKNRKQKRRRNRRRRRKQNGVRQEAS